MSMVVVLVVGYYQVGLNPAVCLLENLVRSRMALVQLHLEYTDTHKARRQQGQRQRGESKGVSTVDRGDASHVIDHILKTFTTGGYYQVPTYVLTQPSSSPTTQKKHNRHHQDARGRDRPRHGPRT